MIKTGRGRWRGLKYRESVKVQDSAAGEGRKEGGDTDDEEEKDEDKDEKDGTDDDDDDDDAWNKVRGSGTERRACARATARSDEGDAEETAWLCKRVSRGEGGSWPSRSFSELCCPLSISLSVTMGVLLGVADNLSRWPAPPVICSCIGDEDEREEEEE